MARPAVPDVLVVLGIADARRLAGAAFDGRHGGRVAMLLRAPEAPARAVLEAAAWLRPRVACLLISDRVDVALAVDADGVHLPERGLAPADARALLGPERLVGASRHDPDGARTACAAGADYVTVSPVWASPGKGRPIGVPGLRAACAAAGGPVLALGGVTPAEVADAVLAGAAGVAVVRAMTDAGDPAMALRALLQSLDAARQPLVGGAR